MKKSVNINAQSLKHPKQSEMVKERTAGLHVHLRVMPNMGSRFERCIWSRFVLNKGPGPAGVRIFGWNK